MCNPNPVHAVQARMRACARVSACALSACACACACACVCVCVWRVERGMGTTKLSDLLLNYIPLHI